MVDAFRENGGEGKPMFLKVQLSYARDEQLALAQAHQQWGANILESQVLSDLHLPTQFEALAKHVQPGELDPFVRISSDLGRHLGWLQEDLAMGFDRLYLHNVNREQEPFIDAFGERVLPQLRAASRGR